MGRSYMEGRHRERHTAYDRSCDGRPNLPQDELDELRKNLREVEEWVTCKKHSKKKA